MRRAWVLVPAAIVAVGMRVLALGDLGGYGTATYPSLAAIPIYWDKFAKYFIDLLYPLPIRQGLMAALALTLLFVCVAAVASLLPDKERFLVWLGLLWVYFFALFYAALKVYAGSWYLYFPLIGASIAIAAMVQGGLKLRPKPVAWVPVGLAGVMTAVVLFSSPLITPYPNWNETTVLMDDYLRHVDTCTEDGDPPLAPPDHDARAAFVNPTGLLDYSVTAYIAIKFPNGRPCG
jgi:hypothetical protein